MKIYSECFECLTRMSLRTLRYSGAGKKVERDIMQRVLRFMGEASEDSLPVDVVAILMDEIRAQTGVDDPYETLKQISTRDALKLYPRMKEFVAASKDPFKTALHIAALGNAIDFGVSDTFDLEEVLDDGLEQSLYAPEIDELWSEIERSPWMLMMGDNAGETVFDRVLIETIHSEIGSIPIKYAVKSNGGLNDAMKKDAVQAGLDQCTEIVETGDGIAGIILRRASDQFRTLFISAPMILSKGVGNYEGLSGNALNTRIYYLFKVKCVSMVHELGIDIGTMVLWPHSKDKIVFKSPLVLR